MSNASDQKNQLYTGSKPDPKPFKCGRCDNAFSIRSELKAHLLSHNDQQFVPGKTDNAFVLTDAQKNEIAREYLDRHGSHSASHQEVRNFETADAVIKSWMKLNYPAQYSRYETQGHRDSCFVTKIQLYAWAWNMQRFGTHKERRADRAALKCDKCDFSTNSKKVLENHIEWIHRTIEEVDGVGDRQEPCLINITNGRHGCSNTMVFHTKEDQTYFHYIRSGTNRSGINTKCVNTKECKARLSLGVKYSDMISWDQTFEGKKNKYNLVNPEKLFNIANWTITKNRNATPHSSFCLSQLPFSKRTDKKSW